jgi:hypothetical protein
VFTLLIKTDINNVIHSFIHSLYIIRPLLIVKAQTNTITKILIETDISLCGSCRKWENSEAVQENWHIILQAIFLIVQVDKKNYMFDWKYSDGRFLGHYILYYQVHKSIYYISSLLIHVSLSLEMSSYRDL